MEDIEIEEVDVECEEAINDENVDKPEKKRRFQSRVWQFFSIIEGTNPPRARHNLCGKDLAADVRRSGTSGLWNHHKFCEKNRKKGDLKGQQVLAFEAKKEGDDQGGNLISVYFDKETYRLAIAKYVVVEELPFRHVESEGFKELVFVLEPRLSIPSRLTISRDIIQLYLDEKEKLKKVLKNERISFSTDTWTSIQNINYMCITAHWIDRDWKLQKRIINFCQISDHKGETIGKELEACINEWGIHKLFTITVDNASSNNTAIEYIKRKFRTKKGALVLDGEFLHLRCCAHIVNLIVTEGLKEKHYSISAIRNAVRYVRSSPSRLLIFKECVQREGIDCKKLLSLDVPTRWNSTYLMLESALKFQKAFESMNDDLNFMSYFVEKEKDGISRCGPPRESDGDNAAAFVKFLRTFYEVTLKFSGSTYVTSNLYFLEICEIQAELEGMWEDEVRDESCKNMAALMKRKYEKYWGNINATNSQLIIATVLDPRYKLGYVKHSFELFHDGPECAKLVKTVKDTFIRIFDHYNESLYGVKKTSPPNSSTPPITLSSQLGKVMSKFLNKRIHEDDDKVKSEIDKYLIEPCEDLIQGQHFDILGWWKLNSEKYKVLSAMARDVLAVLVTTVPSESAFSTGGRILDPFRSSLSPKTVEGIICLKNWWSGNKQPVIIKEYMDEAEILEISEQLEQEMMISPPLP